MKDKIWLLLVPLLVMIVAASGINVVCAVEVTATISVGSDPRGVVYDSSKGEIFVVNYYDNTVSVISDNSYTVVATVPVGAYPVGVAYDLGKGEIFVTNSDDDTVSVISDSNNTVVATVPVGANPVDLAYDSGVDAIFVANYDSNSVSVISDKNNTVIATVHMENHPLGIAYDSGKNEIFVTQLVWHSDSSSYGTFSVIADSTNAVVATGTLGNNAGLLTYDSGKGEIIVANMDDDKVSVISDNSNTVVATMELPQGNHLYDVTYDADKSTLFFSGYSGTNGRVWVMSDTTYEIIATVNLPPVDLPPYDRAYGIAYDAVNGEVYVANNERLTMNGEGVVCVISDSFLPSVSPNPAATTLPNPSASPTPIMSVSPSLTPPPSSSASPTVPEFIPATVLIVAVATCFTAITAKRHPRTN